MNRRLRWLHWLRRWHALAGVAAAVFLTLLVLTGILLNHTVRLGLADIEMRQGWLTERYGLHGGIPRQGWRLGTSWLVADGGVWVMDERALGRALPAPVGAVESGGLRFIAETGRLHIYDAGGRRIEVLDGSALPGLPLTRLGASAAGVVVETPRGAYASRDGLDWLPAGGAAPAWSSAEALPDAVRARIGPHFTPFVPAERVLQDLHSGRLFGSQGPLVMDAAALGLLFLACSGVFMYFRAWRMRRRMDALAAGGANASAGGKAVRAAQSRPH